jgi:MFS superfamily sulfate permease-like transporter
VKSPISLPRARDVKNDLIAGLTTGLVQIPDAMASAILAAVKPVNGLNTLVIGTPIGALFAGLREAWIPPDHTQRPAHE